MMFAVDTIAALPISQYADPRQTPFRIGDWLCGGAWGVRGGADVLALAKSERTVTGVDLLAEYDAALPGEPATEDVTLRLPFVPGIEDEVKKCRDCSGTGEHDCNCDSCDVGCETCDGEGDVVTKEGKAEDPGQRVFRSGEITTILAARYAHLLDGFRVVRLGPTNLDPLGGVDADGKLVVLVMPMRGEVRPAAVTP